MKKTQITFFADDDFKAALENEAEDKNISISELIKSKFEDDEEDRNLLRTLIDEVNISSIKANKSFDKGLSDLQSALDKINYHRR